MADIQTPVAEINGKKFTNVSELLAFSKEIEERTEAMAGDLEESSTKLGHVLGGNMMLRERVDQLEELISTSDTQQKSILKQKDQIIEMLITENEGMQKMLQGLASEFGVVDGEDEE